MNCNLNCITFVVSLSSIAIFISLHLLWSGLVGGMPHYSTITTAPGSTNAPRIVSPSSSHLQSASFSPSTIIHSLGWFLNLGEFLRFSCTNMNWKSPDRIKSRPRTSEVLKHFHPLSPATHPVLQFPLCQSHFPPVGGKHDLLPLPPL